MKSFNKLYQTIIEARFLTIDKPKHQRLTFKNFHRSPAKVWENVRYYSREKIIPAMYRTLSMGRPIFVAGEPGVAKSHTIRQLAQRRAEEMGRKCVVWARLPLAEREYLVTPEAAEERAKYYFLMDVRANLMAKEDATGIPDMFKKAPYTNYRPQFWLYYCTLENSAGMVFFDEITQGADEVLKALMQFFLDRQIGEHALNDVNGFWDITSAGNTRSEDRNYDIPPALLQRATPFGMTITTEEWVNYARSINISDENISFVAAGYKLNPDGTEENKRLTTYKVIPNQNSPSPRSLEAFSNVYKQILDDENMPVDEKEDEIKQHAEGLLGYEWSDQFMVYLEMSHKLDFKKYTEDTNLFFDDPDKYVSKYKLTDNQKNEIKKSAEVAADHIETKYFKHDEKIQLGIVLQLARELFEIVSTDLLSLSFNKVSKQEQLIPDTTKQSIKQFLAFIRLMEITNHTEINAILAGMFMTDKNKADDVLAKLFVIICIVDEFKSFKNKFKEIFKIGNRMQEGRYGVEDEDEESSTNSQSIMSADNWKKLMQIKHKVDIIYGLQNT